MAGLDNKGQGQLRGLSSGHYNTTGNLGSCYLGPQQLELASMSAVHRLGPRSPGGQVMTHSAHEPPFGL